MHHISIKVYSRLSRLITILLISGFIFLFITAAGIYDKSILALSSILLMASAVISIIIRTLPNKLSIFFLLSACWIFFTCINLPKHFEKIDNERSIYNHTAKTILDECKEKGLITDFSIPFSLTLNKYGSIRIGVQFLTVFSAIFLTSLMRIEHKKILAMVLIIIVTVYSVIGILHQWIIPSKHILWLIKVADGRPVGVFVNRSHHAGFIAMFIPLTASFFIKALKERKFHNALFYIISAIIQIVGIISGLSRGAIVATITSLSFMFILSMFYRDRTVFKLSAVFFIFITFSALITVYILKENLIPRYSTLFKLAEEDSAITRINIYKDTFKMFMKKPVIGYGAGSFRMIYPFYQSLSTKELIHHAENEYLEILVESGIVGITGLIILSGIIIASIKSKLKNNFEITGIASSLITAAIHNAVDFCLHIPLYAYSAAFISAFITKKKNHLANTTKKNTLVLFNIPLIVTSIILTVISFIKPDIVTKDYPHKLANFTKEELVEIIGNCPTYAYAWYYLGRRLAIESNIEAIPIVEKCLYTSAYYAPKDYRLWEELGYFRLNIGLTNEAKKAFSIMQELRPWKKSPVK